MKKCICLLSAVILLLSCNKGPNYVIKGKIEGSDNIKFFLLKRDGSGTVTLDSAISKKGSFTMKGGTIDYPQMVQLVAGKTRKKAVFYLENSEIRITGTMDSLFNARVTGSKTQDEYNALLETNKPLSDNYSKIYQEYRAARKANNTAKLASLERQADSIQIEMKLVQKNFVKNNPHSYITPSMLAGLSYEMGAGELDSLINGLDTALAALPIIKSLKDRVLAMKAVEVGKKAPDFTLNDPENKPVSLHSKIGAKLLLIDFWAGWCNPCREENPNLVRIYKEFHKKGFDIFGVSLDRKKEEWLKAITDDKVAWTQVSDLQSKGNEATRLYSVNSIPSNFLLDDNGIIIARNLRGDDLYKKIKELLEK